MFGQKNNADAQTPAEETSTTRTEVVESKETKA